MERLRKRKWEVRVLKYVRLIEISDYSSIPTQFGDNETCSRFLLVMVLCPWPHRKTARLCEAPGAQTTCASFPAPTLLLALGSPHGVGPWTPYILQPHKFIWHFTCVNMVDYGTHLEAQKRKYPWDLSDDDYYFEQTLPNSIIFGERKKIKDRRIKLEYEETLPITLGS